MKKITQNLRWLVTLLAMIVCTGAWAEETITLSEQGYDNGEVVSSTVGTNFTITYNQGTSTTVPAYFDTGKGVRVYAGGNVVVSSEKTMTKVVFTYGKDKSPTVEIGNNAVNSPATWEGSAKSVQLDVKTKGHIRLQSVTVTFEDDGEATLITIAEARAQGTGDVFTSGIVTSCVETTAYIEDATAGICVYGASLTVGDEIQVKGTLTTYNGLLEITSPTYTAVSHENVVAPTIKTIAEINSDYSGSNELQGLLVSIEDATVTAINGQNTTIAQGDNTIVVRGISGVTLAVNDVISLTGNIGCYNAVQIVNPKDVEVSAAPATPSITLSTSAINVSAEGGDGTIEVSYQAFEPESFDIEFCEADGTPLEDGPDWITALCEYPEEGDVVNYSIEPNDGEARTAYFKVFCYPDLDTDPVYSELITVTQAAPVVDYATLPFEFNGGKGDIETTAGLTQDGLGSDYNSETNPTTQLKFDGTGDWVILKINECPGKLSFDIKGNGFSGGTFKVQTSEDGESYTDLNTYTSISGTLSESFDNLGKDVRYIKWVYTAKSSGNVGLGNIQLKEAVPQIIVTNTTIDVDENEHEGTLALSYKNLSITDREDFGIQFYDANNEETTEPDWVEVLVAEEEGGAGYLVSYFMFANEGEARTAYCKVFAIGDDEYVYSNLITINQAAYVAPLTPVKYELVTDVNQLEEGQEYIIVGENDGTYYAMSAQKSNNRGAVEISVSGSIATISSSEVQVITLEEDNDGWNFYTGELGYLYAASSSNNHLKTEATLDENDNAKATIGISSEGDATIVFQGKNTHNNLRFNSSNILFSCYLESSDCPLVQLYKKVEAETAPSVTIGDSKWATYVAEDNVTFPSGVSAYTVETIESDHVTLGEALAVKKDTPILVYSETPGTYTLEVVEEGVCDETYNNQLKVSDGTVNGGANIYALANQDGVVGFYPVSSTITVPAGKAYLEIPPTMSVKGFLALSGLADAINNIAVETANGTIFNIAGQKVQNITKGGLYIVNGKKVFVK